MKQPDAGPVPLADPEPTGVGLRECVACVRPIPADAKVCVYCGYNEHAPPTRLDSPDAPKCRHCGYDLTGLRSPRCPECGKLGTPRRRFVGHGAEISREVARWEYLKPALMILICLPLAFAVNWFFDGRDEALEELFGIAVMIPSAVIAFLMCCVIWIGFDAPVHLTLLRVAGILSAVALTASITGAIPASLWIVSSAINLIVYVGLLAEMLDMDFTDAAIVALLSYFAGLGVWIWLLFAMR